MPRKIRIRIIISLKNWIRIRIKSFWVRHIAYPYRHRKSRARCDHLSTHDVPTYSRKFCPPILSSSANLSIIFCLQLSSSSFSLATTASLPVKTQKRVLKTKITFSGIPFWIFEIQSGLRPDTGLLYGHFQRF